MWMELQWSLWTTKALLFCQRSRANNAPKKSAPELRSPDQKQKNKVCSNANYLSQRINPFLHTNPSTFPQKDLYGCQPLFTEPYCSASGYQRQSPSDWRIIKHCFLFLHLRKSQKPTNSLLKILSGSQKIDTGISCADFFLIPTTSL